MNKSGKVVILGHSGFIGGHLYRKFLEDTDYKVGGFSSRDINLLDENSGQTLAGAYSRDTTIIMVAADSRIRSNSIEVLSNNIRMSLNLSASLEKSKCEHVILLSSIAVYGRTGKNLITEQSPVNPDSFYAVAEVCRENIIRKTCEFLNIPLTILRLGKVYGRSDRKSPIFIFVRNVINSSPIEIYGNGSHNLYCVHENDVFEVVRLIVDESRFGDFNLVPDCSVSLLNLAEMIMSLADKRVPVIFKPSVEVPIEIAFDNSKFKANFKEIILMDLARGINSYFDFIPDIQS